MGNGKNSELPHVINKSILNFKFLGKVFHLVCTFQGVGENKLLSTQIKNPNQDF